SLRYPILELKARHFREISFVTRQERRAIGENNAGDFQIHRPNAHTFATKSDEQISRIGIPRKHRRGQEESDAALQKIVKKDLRCGSASRWICASEPRNCS